MADMSTLAEEIDLLERTIRTDEELLVRLFEQMAEVGVEKVQLQSAVAQHEAQVTRLEAKERIDQDARGLEWIQSMRVQFARRAELDQRLGKHLELKEEQLKMRKVGLEQQIAVCKNHIQLVIQREAQALYDSGAATGPAA